MNIQRCRKPYGMKISIEEQNKNCRIFICWDFTYVSVLTDEEIPSLGQQDGAGESDSIQRHCTGAAVYTPIMQQPDQPTAQAEIHRPAVGNDTIVTLNEEEKTNHSIFQFRCLQILKY